MGKSKKVVDIRPTFWVEEEKRKAKEQELLQTLIAEQHTKAVDASKKRRDKEAADTYYAALSKLKAVLFSARLAIQTRTWTRLQGF